MRYLKLATLLVAAGTLASTTPARSAQPASSINLLDGASPEICCSRQQSTEKRWSPIYRFASPGKYNAFWRATFNFNDPSACSQLMLHKPAFINKISLNGKTIKLPLKNMLYETVPISPSLLLPGRNVLLAEWNLNVDLKKDKDTARASYSPAQLKASDTSIKLTALTTEDLKFNFGPILGRAGTSWFTVTCGLNMPAAATLHINNRAIESPQGLMHHFDVKNLRNATQYSYYITAALPGGNEIKTDTYTVSTLPKTTPVSIVFLGDSRSHPEDWKKVAEAVAKEKPALTVFTGDMVANGRNTRMWLKDFFAPAKNLLATTPVFAVIGNHEYSDILFSKVFTAPTGSDNWTMRLGPALLIGINGEANWSPGSHQTQWLENILSKSKDKYIFLATHFPPYSSGYHCKLAVTGKHSGQPKEKTVRQARTVIMPLLEKYHATALFAGHDHFYERSETPGGVSVVVTGGAGAPLRDKVKNARKQNPYSSVFVKTLHFCLLKINKDACRLKVITPEGRVIDKKPWHPRQTK